MTTCSVEYCMAIDLSKAKDRSSKSLLQEFNQCVSFEDWKQANLLGFKNTVLSILEQLVIVRNFCSRLKVIIHIDI